MQSIQTDAHSGRQWQLVSVRNACTFARKPVSEECKINQLAAIDLSHINLGKHPIFLKLGLQPFLECSMNRFD